jgi:Calpain family cysteine protease
MPPKPEKKKTARGKELQVEPQIDYTRVPLQLEAASNAAAAAASEAKSELIQSLALGCTHEYSAAAIASEDWGLHSDNIFSDNTLELAEAAQWVRAKELVKQRPIAIEAAAAPTAGSKGKPKAAKEAAAKPKAKGKGAAATSSVTDRLEDDDGLLLPRVVLSADSSDGTNSTTAALAKPERAALNAVTVQSESVRSSALASVFTAINSLATTISACNGTPFLWEAIHPQDSSGRPCYNPAGKYVVQLWAAGEWRRVTVDDRVPLTAAGTQLLPCTADSRELWPLLLSKALLKLHALLPAVAAAAAAVPVPAAQESAQYAAFCMSALTGWGTAAAPVTSLQSIADVASDAPRLLQQAFELPELPSAGAAEEKSREKEEARLRRQALFLHKRRRPKRIERHTATAEEVSAILQFKMRCVHDGVLSTSLSAHCSALRLHASCCLVQYVCNIPHLIACGTAELGIQ